jgi:hypothetical protein
MWYIYRREFVGRQSTQPETTIGLRRTVLQAFCRNESVVGESGGYEVGFDITQPRHKRKNLQEFLILAEKDMMGKAALAGEMLKHSGDLPKYIVP